MLIHDQQFEYIINNKIVTEFDYVAFLQMYCGAFKLPQSNNYRIRVRNTGHLE